MRTHYTTGRTDNVVAEQDLPIDGTRRSARQRFSQREWWAATQGSWLAPAWSAGCATTTGRERRVQVGGEGVVRTVGRAGLRPYHQLCSGGQSGETLADQVAKTAPDLVPDDRVTNGARYDKSRLSRRVGLVKMHNDSAPSGPTARTDRGGELTTSPQALPRGEHNDSQAERRARPLARREEMIARPARVRMRSRKPWVFARRRLFGW
jgi:hypothetical protein